MRMIIVNIECENNRIYVIGKTTIGNIKGEWCYKEIPILGQTYFFELNIGEIDRKVVSVICDEQFCPSVNLDTIIDYFTDMYYRYALSIKVPINHENRIKHGKTAIF